MLGQHLARPAPAARNSGSEETKETKYKVQSSGWEEENIPLPPVASYPRKCLLSPGGVRRKEAALSREASRVIPLIRRLAGEGSRRAAETGSARPALRDESVRALLSYAEG